MHEEDNLRRLLAEAADGVGPGPDLAPGALKAGRRALAVDRVRNGAIAVAAVAAVLTPAAVVAPWWDGPVSPGAQYTQNMPLHPANWPANSPLAPPTTAYPLVHVPPTGKTDKSEEPPLEQREVEYAYKQKVADILQKLLPAGIGQIQIEDHSMNAYRLVVGDLVFPVTFRVDQRPAWMQLPPSGTCADSAGAGGRPVTGCLDGRLPDGTPVTVSSQRTGVEPGVVVDGGPEASFTFRETQVMLMFHGASGEGSGDYVPPPVTAEQVLKLATDQEFVDAVQFWAENPTRESIPLNASPGPPGATPPPAVAE